MRGRRRTIGLIGGSGLSEFFEKGSTKAHRVSTPWGAPSAAIVEGKVGDLRVLFLPRHGIGHAIPPHRVNYRANIDALRELGAEAIVTVNSVGSLKEELPPGTFVLPEQFVDLTRQRPTTFFDGGRVFHVSMADPMCPDLTAHAIGAGTSVGCAFETGRTYVCVEGPRFSTRAESMWFRGFADVIGMTLVPEVTLARERGICYVCLATVTDYDVWAATPVQAKDVMEVMGRNTEKMRRVLTEMIPRLAEVPNCACANALENAGL